MTLVNRGLLARVRATGPFALLCLTLTACSGNYEGQDGTAPSSSAGNGGGSGNGQAQSMEQFFGAKVQPRMDFCRTCHIPGGVADVENGRDFQLTQDHAQDLQNLKASWQRLGENNPTSRILLMASGQEAHTGGAPWPTGSDAYRDVEIVLKCFQNPDGCGALTGGSGGGTVPDAKPLLGSKRGGHAWFDYCEGKDNSAVLPADPRSLVQPGVSDGKAVYFNAFWKDCHADPALINERATPKTCGELRTSVAQGAQLMEGHGAVGSGNFFAGNDTVGAMAISAAQYNELWKLWGLRERPDNFDELLAERYGMGTTAKRNPYPLPGENPNATNGGSGQLPGAFTQIRTPQGGWTGEIGLTCHGCHSSTIGSPKDGSGPGFLYGLGNAPTDTALTGREIGIGGRGPMAIFSLFGTSRGTNNASDVNLFFMLDQQNGVRIDPQIFGILTSGSTASGDTPQWWNLGHRPLKFQDGFFAGDAARVDLIFYRPLSGGDAANDWVRKHAPAANDWIMSLRSPAYPLPVDTALAEQGAVLFHAKDLWAAGLNNPVPRPKAGNGSCASCHGAYSPRYVHDPAYLADPALEGIASYIVPKSVIRTDPERVNTNNEAVQSYGSTSFLGYPETVGTQNDCGPQQRAELRGEREFGYLAPPLYGVWASAPYLHNGSVPDAWALLKPEDRPKIWRRVSTPARSDQQGKVVMGFDTNLQRAYDQQTMGWKYDELACGVGTLPFIECSTSGTADPLVQQALSLIYGNVAASWNVGNLPALLQWTPQQVEKRKIYNTHLFSQGNEGHDFTTVLTDAERRALIEYMKTL